MSTTKKPARISLFRRMSDGTVDVIYLQARRMVNHFTLREATRSVFRHFKRPIVCAVARDEVTCLPIAWTVRERARHELPNQAMRHLIQQEAI